MMIEPLDTQYAADQQFRRELKQIKPLSEQEEAAIYERIRSGDTSARRELVTPNLPFAVAYVKRFNGCGIEYADLRQIAAIGLMEAADQFDPNEKAAFRTFAVYQIRAAAVRAIEEQGCAVRIPSHLMHAALRYRRFVSAFLRDYGREPSDVEVETGLGFPRSKLETLRRCIQPIVSLDQPIGDGDGDMTFGDTVEGGCMADEIVITEDERQGLHDDLNRLLNDLPSDEENAIRGHYFRRETYAQIAESAGTTEKDVYNSIVRGIRRLRKPIQRRILNKYIDDYCIDRYAYKSGLKTWQESGSSSTERTVLKMLEYSEKPEASRNEPRERRGAHENQDSISGT